MIECFTDGSYNHQTGFGAWAAIIFIKGQRFEINGTERESTHNRMEILAVIKAIDFIENKINTLDNINIYSDSQYVINLPNRLGKFKSLNFHTKKGTEIQNIDLVKQLLQLYSKGNVTLIKVKAHQKKGEDVNYNREVDKLVRKLVREASC